MARRDGERVTGRTGLCARVDDGGRTDAGLRLKQIFAGRTRDTRGGGEIDR